MDQAKLETVRKLLAKAENAACTEQEAEAFFAKAQELMTKYAIESHMLGVADPTKREAIVSVTMFAEDKGTMLIKAKRELIASLANVNQCSVILGPRRAWLEITGHESDVDLVQVLFNSIMIQLQTGLVRAERDGEVFDKRDRVSYAHGYVSRVWDRLKAAKRAAVRDATTPTTPGTDLVLVDRTKLVQAAVAAKYPVLRSGRMSTSADRGSIAFGAGVRDGSSANLGQRGVANDRRSIGS